MATLAPRQPARVGVCAKGGGTGGLRSALLYSPGLLQRCCWPCSGWGGLHQRPFPAPISPRGCFCRCREQGGFQDSWSSGGYRGLGKKRCRRLRQSCRQLTIVRPAPCHWPARGLCDPVAAARSPELLPSISRCRARSHSRCVSHPAGKQPPFRSNAPRPLPSSKDAAQHKEQTPPVVGFYPPSQHPAVTPVCTVCCRAPNRCGFPRALRE